MTSEALALTRSPSRLRHSWMGRIAPIIVVAFALVAIWYVAALIMNAGMARDAFDRAGTTYGIADLIEATWSAERPRLPAPHQIVQEFARSVATNAPSSPRSLLYHSWVTLSATLVGFAIGAVFGIVLATSIVHVRALEKSLLPWIICSQMVPILAIA